MEPKNKHKLHAYNDPAIVGRNSNTRPYAFTVLGQDWFQSLFGVGMGGLGHWEGTDIDAPTAQGEEWESNDGAESSQPAAPTGGVAGAAGTV